MVNSCAEIVIPQQTFLMNVKRRTGVSNVCGPNRCPHNFNTILQDSTIRSLTLASIENRTKTVSYIPNNIITYIKQVFFCRLKN